MNKTASAVLGFATLDSGVISRMPSGRASTFALLVPATSPCQRCTGTSNCSHISSSRRCWSLISAFSGET
jgi:hypothetical protein